MTTAGVHYEFKNLEALTELPRYHRWIRDEFGADLRGRVLEVGAGIGNFAETYVDGVARATLVEPAPELFPALQARFAGRAHVEARQGLLGEAVAAAGERGDAWEGAFDAVAMVNVLEHVPDDVGLLREARALLRPGGSLLIFVPAMPWLFGTLDELVDHLRRYTRATLLGAITAAGFAVERSRYFDVAGALPWWFTGRVARMKRFDERMAKAYDRWVVPPASAVERLIAPPFGKNLVCVARRVEASAR